MPRRATSAGTPHEHGSEPQTARKLTRACGVGVAAGAGLLAAGASKGPLRPMLTQALPRPDGSRRTWARIACSRCLSGRAAPRPAAAAAAAPLPPNSAPGPEPNKPSAAAAPCGGAAACRAASSAGAQKAAGRSASAKSCSAWPAIRLSTAGICAARSTHVQLRGRAEDRLLRAGWTMRAAWEDGRGEYRAVGNCVGTPRKCLTSLVV